MTFCWLFHTLEKYRSIAEIRIVSTILLVIKRFDHWRLVLVSCYART